MDKLQRIITFFGDIVKTFGGLFDLLSLFTSGGVGVVAVLAFLSKQPPSFFIVLAIVAVSLTSLAIIRIIYRYKRWDKLSLKEEPKIAEILKAILDMYLEENKIARLLADSMTIEDINTVLPDDALEIFGVKKADLPIIQDLPTKAEIASMELVLRKLLKFSMSAKWVIRLMDFGGVFERKRKGIKTFARTQSEQYPILEEKLRQLRLNLPVCNDTLSKIIDNTLYYSYILNSIMFFELVITNTREKNGLLPTKYLARFKTYEITMEGLFNMRLGILRRALKRAIVKASGGD